MKILSFFEDVKIAINLKITSINNNKINKITNINHTKSIIKVKWHNIKNVEDKISGLSKKIDLYNVFNELL